MRKPTAPQLAQLARALAQVYGVNIPDFDRAFEQLYTPFNTLIIDLSRTQGQSPAGDVYPSIGGDFIYVDTDTSALNPTVGSVSIELNDQTNADKAGFTANPGFALNAVFTSLKVRYTNQPGKRLVLKYSTGFSVIPSFSGVSQISGNVNTNEIGGRARSLAGSSFIGLATQNAVAAQNPTVQLWNPGPKVAYVNKITAWTSLAAPDLFLYRYNAALANLSGNAPNKRINSAGSQCELRIQSIAGGLGTEAFARHTSQANVLPAHPFEFTPDPLEIPANAGVNVRIPTTVNLDLNVTFDFSEE